MTLGTKFATSRKIIGVVREGRPTDLARKARLSVPGPGRTLSAVVEKPAVNIRRAVRLLEDAFRPLGMSTDFEELFSPRFELLTEARVDEPIHSRAAWAVASIWLLARSAGKVGSDAGFPESERWFLGSLAGTLPSLATRLPKEVQQQALEALSLVALDEGFQDLLPYVLDPHGPGSRLSVMRNPETRTAREAKRRTGTFYTPADVAEYVAERAVTEYEGPTSQIRCLDPSCGTGVFLLALMRAVAKASGSQQFSGLEYAAEHLYGFDISTLAIETCTFVLLHHCLSEEAIPNLPPWCAWHALRLNLTAVDALKVSHGASAEGDDSTDAAAIRAGMRQRLLNPGDKVVIPPRVVRSSNRDRAGMWEMITAADGSLLLKAVYPEAAEGFDLLIGNPPYARLGSRRDFPLLQEEYASLRTARITGNENVYLLFIEMMWRLARPGRNGSALVLPLSIAYHQGRQYRACRQAMSTNGGRFSFAFFDREPHALFGEDVKTRNAIVFRRESDSTPQRGSPAEINTGPLLKWTSRSRESMFQSITSTPLGRVEFARGIPKLKGKEQAAAFRLLSGRTDTIKTLWLQARSCQPVEACADAVNPRVFVASTAYNFLNVFRSLPRTPSTSHPLSENSVLCLEFDQEDNAVLAFAILSSRLVYWLWQVQGDGFHVSRRFVESIPFGKSSFNVNQAEILKKYGDRLWFSLQSHQLVSVNGGKQTIAYRPLALAAERDVIDATLCEAAHIPNTFLEALRVFIQELVVVDGSDAARRHLKSYFASPEDPE